MQIIRIVASKGKERISKFARKIVDELFTDIDIKNKKEQLITATLENVDSNLNFRKDIEHQAIDSVKILLTKTNENVDELINEMKKAISIFTENEISQTNYTIKKIVESMGIRLEPQPKKKKDKFELYAEKIVPRKNITGPLSSLNLGDLTYTDMEKMNDISEEYKEMLPIITTALFWIDGKRTVAEISKLVDNDIGKTSIPYILKMIEFYKEYKILELEEKE